MCVCVEPLVAHPPIRVGSLPSYILLSLFEFCFAALTMYYLCSGFCAAGQSDYLLPLTYFKHIGELRFGILTQLASWQLALGEEVRLSCDPVVFTPDDTFVYAGLLTAPEIVERVKNLKPATKLETTLEGKRVVLAYRAASVGERRGDNMAHVEEVVCEQEENMCCVTRPWHIFACAEKAIAFDFDRLTTGRQSAALDPSVRVCGQHPIFVEEGAKLWDCTLNASEGPIYIGAEAEVMEGAHIRGSFALGIHSVVKMGAKIYGATTIGPHCKVGGELANVNFQGYSNKAHDGFLGNSVIGSWCNLGADTNCSNLKNTYDEVRVWSVPDNTFVRTGQQFCGLLMGDHSKTGINTMLNTGTVIGAFCNIFGGGFPRTWIPPFSWGGSAGFKPHDITTALETAKRVMARRGVAISQEMEDAARKLHTQTVK